MNYWMLGCFLAFSSAVVGCGDGGTSLQRNQDAQNNAHTQPDAAESEDEADESDASDIDDQDAVASEDPDDGSADALDTDTLDTGVDALDGGGDQPAVDAEPSDANGEALDGNMSGSIDGSDAADGQVAGSDGAASDAASGVLDGSADAAVRDSGAQLDAASPDAGGGRDASADAGDAAVAGDAQPEAGGGLTYYRDAKPIIDAKCVPCHHVGGIAPFPLTSYAEVAPYKQLIRSDVAAGIMPPWQASGPLGVFVGDRRLSEQQKNTLLTWIDQGALAGDARDAAPEIPPDQRGLGRVDLSLPIAQPYTQTLRPDDYRCFVLEWPYRDPKYVTGVSIEPDRTQSVHHAILYVEPPENASSVRLQDALDPGSGFSCFSNLSSLNTWLTSYEPGGYGQSLPDGLGFEVRPGSLMVLQVHYNSLNGVGSDASRVDFEIADRVERVVDVAQLLDASWVLLGMSIPADAPDVVHRWRGRPSNLGSNATYDIHWVDLHMHTLGSRGSVSIVRSGLFGRVEPLLEIPDWEFSWQQTYVLRQPVKLNPGDQLQVECHFDNTAGNQMIVDGQRLEPRDVTWGEGTTDEMCLGNVLVSPTR